jgi:CRISPR-associated protein Csc2
MASISKLKDVQLLLEDYSAYFVDTVTRSRKERPEIALVVLRTVTEPVLFRNTSSERAEILEINGQIRAKVNGEKFVSVERLTGLGLCRHLDKNGSIIQSDHLYNEVLRFNPDTITYGGVSTESGENWAIKARVLEGYTFSVEPYDILNKEQHNALYETGTMRHAEGESEGEAGTGFYAHVNIPPQTKFVHFVRLEAPTIDIFLYILHNILNSTHYGARSSRKGHIRNEILGLIFSPYAIGVSSGELLQEYFTEDTLPENRVYERKTVVEKIKSYVDKQRNSTWKEIWANSKEFKPFDEIIKIATLKDSIHENILKESLERLKEQGDNTYSS